MLALANLFRKYLREYTSRVLVASLPYIGNITEGFSSYQLSQLFQTTTGILANFSSRLRKGRQSGSA